PIHTGTYTSHIHTDTQRHTHSSEIYPQLRQPSCTHTHRHTHIQPTHILTHTLCSKPISLHHALRLSVFFSPNGPGLSPATLSSKALKILQNTSSLLVSESPALQLLCVADSNPPAQLSWFRGSPALEASPISSTGVLALTYLGSEETEFTCQAQNPLGSQNTSLNLFVVSPPQLLGPSCSQEDEGLRCSCSSRARPAPSLRWRLGEGLLEGNFSNASFEVTSSFTGPWTNSFLSLREGLSSGLSLSCEALNIYGVRNGSVLLLPGQGSVGGEGRPAFLALGALGGAGAGALLSACLCLLLFFIVKARRKQAATRPEGVDDEDPVMGTVAWGSRQKPCSDSPLDQTVLSPAEDAPPPGEQEELHYASLSFHGMTSREPQDQEATSTEYSEIKKVNEGLSRPRSQLGEPQPLWEQGKVRD
ncbi:hypothetical protein FD754_013899, partial [Muntiacus muntjak]